MKKLSIILCLVLTMFSTAKSQSFINLSKVWLMSESYCVGQEDENCYQLFFAKFGEDTVIDETHYRKTIKTSDTSSLNWKTFGFIRETVDKKIYFRSFKNGVLFKEKLLFDFNADIDDTLHNIYSYYGYPDVPAIVTQIDSVNLLHGKEKRINLKYVEPKSNITIEWVENIGDYQGGIIPNGEVPTGSDVFLTKCFFDHGKLLLKKPIIIPRYYPDLPAPWVYDTVKVECNYPDFSCLDTISALDTIWITDTIKYVDTLRVFDTIRVTVLDSASLTDHVVLYDDLNAEIYPNPTANWINIAFNKAVNALSYKLLNNSGRTLISKNLYNTDRIRLNVSEYPPGTYFLHITIDNKDKTFKVLIE